MKLLVSLALNSFALFVVSYIVPGFYFANTTAIVITAVVIGMINKFIKPVLQILALPISIITFGVSALLINVFLLWISSLIVPGFNIINFTTTVIASITLSLVSWFLHQITKEDKKKK